MKLEKAGESMFVNLEKSTLNHGQSMGKMVWWGQWKCHNLHLWIGRSQFTLIKLGKGNLCIKKIFQNMKDEKQCADFLGSSSLTIYKSSMTKIFQAQSKYEYLYLG